MKKTRPDLRWAILSLTAAALLGPAAVSGAEVCYGDRESKRYHLETCPAREHIAPKNLLTFASEAEAGARGYYPCPTCVPGVGVEARPQAPRRMSVPVARGQGFTGDPQTREYHYPWCAQAGGRTSGLKNFETVQAAVGAGYTPCPECHPPVLPEAKTVGATTFSEEEKTEQNLRQAEEAAQQDRLKQGGD